MDTKQSLANVIIEAIEACYPGVEGLPDAAAIAGIIVKELEARKS